MVVLKFVGDSCRRARSLLHSLEGAYLKCEEMGYILLFKIYIYLNFPLYFLVLYRRIVNSPSGMLLLVFGGEASSTTLQVLRMPNMSLLQEYRNVGGFLPPSQIRRKQPFIILLPVSVCQQSRITHIPGGRCVSSSANTAVEGVAPGIWCVNATLPGGLGGGKLCGPLGVWKGFC